MAGDDAGIIVAHLYELISRLDHTADAAAVDGIDKRDAVTDEYGAGMKYN